MRTIPAESAYGRRIGAAVCAVVAGTWLVLLLASPYLVSRGPVGDAWSGLAEVTYVAGRMVCHQRSDRSFHAWGVQLPVCGRCFGLYAAALAGAVWAAYRAAGKRNGDTGDGANWARRLIAAGVPTAVSFTLENAGVWAQSPLIRAVAAAPLGFTIAWFVAGHAAEVFHTQRGRV